MDWSLESTVTNQVLLTYGPFAPYVANTRKLYKCPADSYLSPSQRRRGFTARTRSYSMNGYMGPCAPSWGRVGNVFFPRSRQFLKLGDISAPSEIYVTLDEHPDSINDGMFLIDAYRRSSW